MAPLLRSILMLAFGSFAVAIRAADSGGGITVEQARGIMTDLRVQVARHDELYHREAAPEIEDYAYDELKKRLRDLEREFPELAKAGRAVPEVGDDRTGVLRTARHRERMLSLDKTYSSAELQSFLTRLARRLGRDDLDYVIEPKFDGLAVSVTYENGRLVRAVTRGNGTEGDDITANVRMLPGVPGTLAVDTGNERTPPLPELMEVRGEVYVPFEEFQRVNAEREMAGEPLFANPRNLAAGTIRQVDPRVVVGRGLAVVFYGVGAFLPAEAQPPSQRALHEAIRAWGLPGVEEYWTASDAHGVWAAVQAIGRARKEFGFPSDGAVVKLDRVALQREAGAGSSTPRWAIAYKFEPERAETQVKAITVQVGRTGVLTPVAEFAPVELAGSKVTRATLHNRDEIARKDIRVGDYVLVEKAGEIVPAIVRVNRARRPEGALPFVFPEFCPICHAAVAQRPLTVAVHCPNGACPAQLRRRLEHFASKDALGIEGLGPAMIESLVAAGWVKDLPDIYRLRRDDLLTLGDNVGRSTDRLLAAIEQSKQAELWRFIYGFGAPQVGIVAAKEIARRVRDLDGLASASGSADSADSSSRALTRFFAEPRIRQLVVDLIAVGARPVMGRVSPDPGRFAGKTFVLTGTLPSLTRVRAVERIESAGGKVGSGVTRRTDYVLAGSDSGEKLAQARQQGVTIIDEAEFLRLLGQ